MPSLWIVGEIGFSVAGHGNAAISHVFRNENERQADFAMNFMLVEALIVLCKFYFNHAAKSRTSVVAEATSCQVRLSHQYRPML